MAGEPLRVLLIQSWVIALDGMRARLADVGFIARFQRADFASAVEAALVRGGFDVIVFDPATPGVSRGLIEAHMKAHAIRAPLVILDGAADIGHLVRCALTARRN